MWIILSGIGFLFLLIFSLPVIAVFKEIYEKKLSIQKTILERLDRIMADANELVQKLNAVAAQQEKTKGEITNLQGSVDGLKQQIKDLQDQLGSGSTITPELIAAVDAVALKAQEVDDLIPDLP